MWVGACRNYIWERMRVCFVPVGALPMMGCINDGDIRFGRVGIKCRLCRSKNTGAQHSLPFFVAAVLSVLTHPHFLPSHNLPLVRPCRPLAVAEPEQPDPRPGGDDDSVRRWLHPRIGFSSKPPVLSASGRPVALCECVCAQQFR